MLFRPPVAAVLTCLLSALGCTPPAAAPTIKGSFLVQYLAEAKTLKAVCFFQDPAITATTTVNQHEFLNTLQVDNVRFNGILMRYRAVTGQYELTNTTDFDGTLAFAYTLPNGKSETTTVSVPVATRFALPQEGISRSAGGLLSWEGAPLAANESLYIIIDGASDKPLQMNLLGSTTATKIHLRPQQLTALQVGKTATVSVVRKYHQRIGNHGIVVEYYAAPINAQVRD